MCNFKISFNKDLIYRSNSGAITAPIFLDWGDLQFPEKGWSDFVVVVLSWWIEAVVKLIRGWEKEVEFSFMDGPMLLKVRLIEKCMVIIQCIDQRATQEIIDYQATVPMAELTLQLGSVSRDVLSVCNENGWNSDDIRALEKELLIFDGVNI